MRSIEITHENTRIKFGLQKYIFMTMVYGCISFGLIIASKKQLLDESQIATIFNIVFNGGLDFEYFGIVIAAIIFTKGIYSFWQPEYSTIFACEAFGVIILTLGELGPCLFILYFILFNGVWLHIFMALLVWILLGFIGIILSDFQLLIFLLNNVTLKK